MSVRAANSSMIVQMSGCSCAVPTRSESARMMWRCRVVCGAEASAGRGRRHHQQCLSHIAELVKVIANRAWLLSLEDPPVPRIAANLDDAREVALQIMRRPSPFRSPPPDRSARSRATNHWHRRDGHARSRISRPFDGRSPQWIESQRLEIDLFGCGVAPP